MMEKFSLASPSTIYVFIPVKTEVVKVFCCQKGLYYFRYLLPETENIKINIPHPGKYEISAGFITKVTPIEIEPLLCNEPEPDRQREKRYIIKYNHSLTGSPARNFTHKGIIEVGQRFYRFPFALRVFILLHEVAHFKYSKEEDCDLWAAIQFIKMGYNNSTALYAITKVLKNSDMKQNRANELFNKLNKVKW